jgi:catechol 2,3-dioxygenase-like lactoylglutathione lyase family enzyme
MPRAGLTPAIVVVRGADLADEIGLDHLTLAALASRLGVAVPSLYKHVGGLDALRRGIAILALGELGDAMAGALAGVTDGPDGGAPVRALADAYRAYAAAHPGRYAATLRAAPPGDAEHGAAGDAILRTVFAVLASRGLAGEDAVDATRALRAALHGFVALEAAGGFGLPQDVDRSFGRLVERLDRGFGMLVGDDAAPEVGARGAVGELRLALTVEDYPRALRFYRDSLGLPVLESWEDGKARGAVLGAGRATLELLSPEQAELIDRIEVGSRVAGPVRVALAVLDSAGVADALVAAGAERLGGPVVTPWAHRNVRVAAPDGLQLTLFTELDSRPGDRVAIPRPVPA